MRSDSGAAGVHYQNALTDRASDWLLDHIVKSEKKILIFMWIASVWFLARFGKKAQVRILAVMPLTGIGLLFTGRWALTAPLFNIISGFESNGMVPFFAWLVLLGSVPLIVLICRPDYIGLF